MEVKVKKPRLNFRQRQFFLILCNENLSLEAVLTRCNMKGEEFLDWLAREKFFAALKRVMRLLERRHKLERLIGVLVGLRGLVAQSTSCGDLNQQRLCRMNLAAIGNEFRNKARVFARLRAAQKSKAATAPAGPAMQELPPDLPLEEAERLLRILESDDPPPNGATGDSSA